MKKIRKGKKILLIIFAIIILALAIALIVKTVDKKPETPGTEVEQKPIVLPETTYNGLEVKNISMEYRKDNDETVISMEIHNTTDSKVETQLFTAILIGEDEEIIGEMPGVPISTLEVGQVQDFETVYDGDCTAATQIKLIKK